MFIEQLYTGCLSEAAYYIESGDEAAIIDPLRDIDAYLQLAKERKTKIRYIFETHFHADFVSGHLDLAKSTGAPIIYGPKTETSFPIYTAKDGERFALGEITIEVLHTPGHTVESSCYLVRDANGAPHAIFTGDTLFVGDVGRPDLSSGDLGKEELAGLLYDSLRNKIVPLPDEVIIYPAHGPGSSCGKNLGPNTFSTLADEKQDNYALKEQSKEAFIKAVTEGLETPPSYFPINARINKEGYESLEEVLNSGLKPLDHAEFARIMEQGAILLDTRKAELFAKAFVPGAISIGLDGRFAEWAGSLLPFDKPIILVASVGEEKESIIRLARVGFNKMAGYLEGGFEKWMDAGKPIDMIIDVEADELAMDLPFDQHMLVLDVRREVEYADGHVRGAINIPLTDLVDPFNMASLEEHHNIYVHCGGGYRSIIAASFLKREGIHNLRNVAGGWDRIQEEPRIEIVRENSVLN
jgi:hydroxyacylglutathione hydrolase